MKGSIAKLVMGVVVAAFAAAPAAAATKFVYMDAFRQTFDPLPGGAYGRYYPSVLGGRTPTVSPINSYGGCAVVRFPTGSTVREIKYTSRGDSGFSYAFFQESRYGEVSNLATHMVNPYPSAQLEQTLLATTDTPVRIRRGYRYYLCVEGQPGAAAGDYNEFLGFRITFRRP